MSDTRHSDQPFDAVVAVGSQGARNAFETILGCLPAGFPAAVVLDLHRTDPHGVTELLLGRRGDLPVRRVTDGLALERGVLHTTPPDRQVLLTGDGRLTVGGPRDASPGHPFADVLLGSAARALGPRLIVVVLSGRLDGGARGVVAAKRCGARVLVQTPDSAVAPGMPTAALATGCADFALEPDALGRALVALCAASGAAELFRVRLNAGVAG